MENGLHGSHAFLPQASCPRLLHRLLKWVVDLLLSSYDLSGDLVAFLTANCLTSSDLLVHL